MIAWKSIFKKLEKSPQIKPEVSNPYLNARRAWNEHNAGLMKSLQLWQFVGIASLLITLTTVAGLISIGSQSKFVPLVFQQDSKGNTLTVTRADSVVDAVADDYRLAAANFIENLRLVSVDNELQKKAVYQVYSFLSHNDAALTKVQEYYNDKNISNPFVRAQTETVSIEIQTVIQESKHTWQVDWAETVRGLDGEIKSTPKHMRALVTLYQQSNAQGVPNESVLKNPHLIFVRDFNWSKELKTGASA